MNDVRSARTGSPWVAVVSLAAMYALSLLDRMMISIVAAPLAHDLQISDAHLGLLMGAGFALLYSIAGLPLAQLIDRGNRVVLVASGAAFWGLMTVLSAFATNYTSLLILRCGLAIGEAVLTPAAISLIGDLFTRDRRALPTSVYTSIGSVMSTGAFAVGGLALGVGVALTDVLGMSPWRIAFLVCGLPAVLLAIAFPLLVRDPRTILQRTNKDAPPSTSVTPVSIGELAKYVIARWKIFAPILLGAGFAALFVLSLLSWLPTVMTRELGMNPVVAGYRIGMIVTPMNLMAIYFWPWLAVKLERRYPGRGIPICLTVAAIIGAPLFVGAPLLGDPDLFLAAVGLTMWPIAAWTVLPSLGIQLYAPAEMRGRMTAIYLLVISVVGYGLGPTLTVYLGKSLANGLPGVGARPISLGLSADGAIASVLLLGLAVIALSGARQRIERAE